jgi:hypothetical protein
MLRGSENPNHNIQKQIVQPRDAFEDTAFQPVFEIVDFSCATFKRGCEV